MTYGAWVERAAREPSEIYVAKHVPGAGWQELAGGVGFSTPLRPSASEGGVSNTAGSSRCPSIVIGADGNPHRGVDRVCRRDTSNIRVAKYDPAAAGGQGGSVALGTSLDAGGGERHGRRNRRCC